MNDWHEAWAGLAGDHLFPRCPSRLNSEATIRGNGWPFDQPLAVKINPDGTDVCGLCLYRYKKTREILADGGPKSRRGISTRQRSQQVGVRLLPAEMATLRREAARMNLTMPELLRQAFLATVGAES